MRGLDDTAGLAGLSLESSAAPGLPLAALQRLARQTMVVNPRLGLTGELELEEGRFALALEGRADLLLPLAARILADRRHAAVRVTEFGAIAERRFTGWRAVGFGLEEGPAPRFAASLACPGAAVRPLDLLG